MVFDSFKAKTKSEIKTKTIYAFLVRRHIESCQSRIHFSKKLVWPFGIITWCKKVLYALWRTRVSRKICIWETRIVKTSWILLWFNVLYHMKFEYSLGYYFWLCFSLERYQKSFVKTVQKRIFWGFSVFILNSKSQIDIRFVIRAKNISKFK